MRLLPVAEPSGRCAVVWLGSAGRIVGTAAAVQPAWYVSLFDPGVRGSDPLRLDTGNSAGAPLGGAILSATGGNWVAVSVYSGTLQIVGGLVLLYGTPRSSGIQLPSSILTMSFRSALQA